MFSYVEEEVGTAEVGGGDLGVSFDFPFFLGGLVFKRSTKSDTPAVFLVGLRVGGNDEFVVGEGPGSSAVSVVDADFG